MKPYGLPRSPELGELGNDFAMKSSVYRLKGKGGDTRAQHKSKSKRQSRRIWKGMARRSAEREINLVIGEE